MMLLRFTRSVWSLQRIIQSAIILGAFGYGLLSTAKSDAAASTQETVILVLGDSFTAGLGVSQEAAFPAQLQSWLQGRGVGVRVINAGVSGNTTEAGLARTDQALASRPNIVVLELGANDALRGIHPAITRRNLSAIMTKIERSGAKILLTGILAPVNWGEEYRNAFDRVYPELAASHRVPLYPFFLEDVALNPKLNQPDGLHPNQQGVSAIVDRIGPVIVSSFFDSSAMSPEDNQSNTVSRENRPN